jgi:hypothetical protein
MEKPIRALGIYQIKSKRLIEIKRSKKYWKNIPKWFLEESLNWVQIMVIHWSLQKITATRCSSLAILA